MRSQLSVVYITKNAGMLLDRSLRSVKGVADEIIVVDSGSEDSTCDIARANGARLIEHPWEGFGAQRQFAVSCAQHDWILVMDADEVLCGDAVSSLFQLVANTDAAGFFLRRKNYIGSKEIRHGDWAGEWVLRLVNRNQGYYDPAEVVHESWHGDGPFKRLNSVFVQHYPFANQAEMLIKLRRYAELNGRKVAARGRNISAWQPMTHAMWAFLRCYFLRLGLLDGIEGGSIAWTTALGAYFKYAIARDLLRQDRQ